MKASKSDNKSSPPPIICETWLDPGYVEVDPLVHGCTASINVLSCVGNLPFIVFCFVAFLCSLIVPLAGRDSRFWSLHTSSASVTSPSGPQHKRLALVSVPHLFVVNHLLNQVLGSQKIFCVVLPSGFWLCLWKFSKRDLRLLLLLPRQTRFSCLFSAQLFSLQDSPSHPTFCLSPGYCLPSTPTQINCVKGSNVIVSCSASYSHSSPISGLPSCPFWGGVCPNPPY